MVSVNPTSSSINEIITDLPDSDRFKDVSLLIYQQNSHLYKEYFNSSSLSNNTTANSKISINDRGKFNQPNSVQTQICVLL